MTRAVPQEEVKTRTAAAFFAGFLTLALGGAGVLIAALAVGIERAWNGGEVERDRARERSRGWLDNQRAWLDADHKRRTVEAESRRRWSDSGRDPSTKPQNHRTWDRFATSIRRLFANLVLGIADFIRGFRDGWRAARRARADGADFWETCNTRPHCTNCGRPCIPVNAVGWCEDCAECSHWPDDEDETQPQPLPDDEPEDDPQPEPGGQSAPDAEPDAIPPATPDEPDTSEEKTMPETATNPAPAAESNATVLRGKLTGMKSTLHRIADLTDQLARERATLSGEVRDADEFAQTTGQSAQARQALDEANAVSASMGERLGEFSQNAVSAEEQVAQAAEGLRVAENAEDELRAAGADGRAVAPAGANA